MNILKAPLYIEAVWYLRVHKHPAHFYIAFKYFLFNKIFMKCIFCIAIWIKNEICIRLGVQNICQLPFSFAFKGFCSEGNFWWDKAVNKGEGRPSQQLRNYPVSGECFSWAARRNTVQRMEHDSGADLSHKQYYNYMEWIKHVIIPIYLTLSIWYLCVLTISVL